MKTAETIIAEILSLMTKAQNSITNEGDEVICEEYKRALVEADKMATPESLVTLIRYYEKRIAKMEVEAARYTIMKSAVREVLAEDRNSL